MNIDERNDEVGFLQNSFAPNIMKKDVSELKSRFKKSPRQRYRLCTHDDEENLLHEMIVVYDSSTYVRPNKHLGKSESLLLLEGEIDFYFFNDDGYPIKRIKMDANGVNGNQYLKVPPNTWHGMLMKGQKECVIKETISGPYDNITLLWADWSPANLSATETIEYYAEIETRLPISANIEDKFVPLKKGIFVNSSQFPTVNYNIRDILLDECKKNNVQ